LPHHLPDRREVVAVLGFDEFAVSAIDLREGRGIELSGLRPPVIADIALANTKERSRLRIRRLREQKTKLVVEDLKAPIVRKTVDHALGEF